MLRIKATKSKEKTMVTVPVHLMRDLMSPVLIQKAIAIPAQKSLALIDPDGKVNDAICCISAVLSLSYNTFGYGGTTGRSDSGSNG